MSSFIFLPVLQTYLHVYKYQMHFCGLKTIWSKELPSFFPGLEPVCSDLIRLLLKVHPCGWYFWWLQIRSCCHSFTVFMQLQLLWQTDILKYFVFYLKSNSLVECLDVRQKGYVLQLNLNLRNKQINQHLLFYVKRRPRARFSLLSQIKRTAEPSLQPPSITSSVFKLWVNCQ